MNDKIEYNGIGFFGALAILFIALKLCGVIEWSWAWVFAPLWVPLALFAVFAVVALIVCAIVDKS